MRSRSLDLPERNGGAFLENAESSAVVFYKFIEHYDSMVRVPGWRSVARNDAEGGHREEISGSAASACNASFAAIDCPLSFISFPDDCNMSPFQLFLMSLSVICFTTIDSF